MRVRTQVWLVLAGFFSLALLIQPYAWLREVPPPAGVERPRPDFIAFYSAGLLLREDPRGLYDPEKQAKIEARITGEPAPTDTLAFLPFGYPPITALLYVPLTLLPYTPALLLTIVLNILLAGIALDVMAARMKLNREASTLLVLCFAASLSTIQTLSNGQISFLIFLMLVMLAGDVLEGRRRAGFWAGLLVLKPTLAPVSWLWFAMRREWRNLGLAIAVGAPLLLIPAGFLGSEAVRDFITMGSDMSRGRYLTVQTMHMPNLRALSQFLGARDVLWWVLVPVILLLLYVASRSISDTSVVALLLAIALIPPHIHYQDLSLLWIVVALAIRKTTITGYWRWGLFSATLLSTALISIGARENIFIPFIPVALLILFISFTLRRNPERYAAAVEASN